MSWMKFALIPALLVALSGPPSFVAAQDGETPQSPSVAKQDQGVAKQAQGPLDAAAVKVRTAVRAALRGAPIPAFRPSLKGLNSHQADVGACKYEDNSIRKLCRRGDRSSSRIIVLWGDSHARHWVPAVEAAAKRRGYAAYFFVKPACNAADTLRSYSPTLRPCIRFRAWVARQVKRMDPEILMVAGEMPPILLDENDNSVRDDPTLSKLHSRGLVRAVRPLQSSVGKVVFVADVPGLRLAPQVCLNKPGINLRDCTFQRPYRAVLEAQAAERAATRTHEKFLNPTKWFCYHNQCPTIVDHVLTYRDFGHMLPAYSRSLSSSLARALQL